MPSPVLKKGMGMTPQEVWCAAAFEPVEVPSVASSSSPRSPPPPPALPLPAGFLEDDNVEEPDGLSEGGSSAGGFLDRDGLSRGLMMLNSCGEALGTIWRETGCDPRRRQAVMTGISEHIADIVGRVVEAEEEVAQKLRLELEKNQGDCRELEAALGYTDETLDEIIMLRGDVALNEAIELSEHHKLLLDEVKVDREDVLEVLTALCDDLGGGKLPSSELSESKLRENVIFINQVAKGRESVLKDEIDDEKSKLEGLWEKLMVPGKEREMFYHRMLGGEVPPILGGDVKVVTMDEVKKWVGKDIANVQEGALASSFCGCENMQNTLGDIKREVERLRSQYQEQLAVQVVETKEFLLDLYKQYDSFRKVPTPSAPVIPTDATERNLALIEGDVLVMEKKLNSVKSAVTALQRRGDLLNDKQQMEAAAKDKDRLMDRSRNMAQVLLQEEKTRKALKKELPKIEKFLRSFCEAYLEENGAPFVYGEGPLEAQLQHGVVQQQQQESPPQKTRPSRAPSPSATKRPARTGHSPAPVGARRSAPVRR